MNSKATLEQLAEIPDGEWSRQFDDVAVEDLKPWIFHGELRDVYRFLRGARDRHPEDCSAWAEINVMLQDAEQLHQAVAGGRNSAETASLAMEFAFSFARHFGPDKFRELIDKKIQSGRLRRVGIPLSGRIFLMKP